MKEKIFIEKTADSIKKEAMELELVLQFVMDLDEYERKTLMSRVEIWKKAYQTILCRFDNRNYPILDTDGWNFIFREEVPLSEKKFAIGCALSHLARIEKWKADNKSFKRKYLTGTAQLLRKIGISNKDIKETIEYMASKELKDFKDFLQKRLTFDGEDYKYFKPIYHLVRLSRTYRMFLRMMVSLQQYHSIDSRHLQAIFYYSQRKQRESFKKIARKAMSNSDFKEYFSSKSQQTIIERIFRESEREDFTYK